jgi:hypothetical protein
VRPSGRFTRFTGQLLEWGVIRRRKPREAVAAVCPYFAVPKESGLGRVIVDARQINEAQAPPPTFRLPKIEQVIDTVLQFDWVASVDLRSWFYQLEIHASVGRYYILKDKSGMFVLQRLPMGSSYAPLIAQTVSEALLQGGAGDLVYLDNFVMAGSRSEVEHKLQHLLRVCSEVNVVINVAKSTMQPVQQVEALGADLDLIHKRWRLTPAWSKKAVATLQLGTSRWKLTLRDAWKCLGTLVWGLRVLRVPMCDYFEVMSWARRQAERLARGELQWEAEVVWWPSVMRCIRKAVALFAENPWQHVVQPGRQLEIYSDASGKGWCYIAFQDGRQLRMRFGRWTDQQMKWHINAKEAAAAFYGVRWAAAKHTGCSLLLLIDNQPVVFAVAKRRSPSYLLNHLVRELTEAANHGNCVVSVRWVSTHEQLADKGSRMFN